LTNIFFLALNKQRKRIKGFLVLLFKGLVVFIFIMVVYKGFSINNKLRPELVTKKALI
jgi:hypothetical protein